MEAQPDQRNPTARLDLPHGAYSQIARRLRPKVTPQHVREVYLGRRHSPRVESAIQNYVARLTRGERQEQEQDAPSSAA